MQVIIICIYNGVFVIYKPPLHTISVTEVMSLTAFSQGCSNESLLLEGGCCLVILLMLWVWWACLLSHFLEDHSGWYPLQDYLSVLPDLSIFEIFSLKANHSGSASVNAQTWNTINTHTHTHTHHHHHHHTHSIYLLRLKMPRRISALTLSGCVWE